MSSAQYLVTILHTKKRLFIQHLTSGTINNAIDLAETICVGFFKDIRKYLVSSIIEISDREYNFYNWNEKAITRRRNINNDEVICLLYKKNGRINPNVWQGFNLVNIDDINDISDECFYDSKILWLIQNKFSGKNVTYIDSVGNENNVEYLNAHKTSWFGDLELDGEPKVTKLCGDKKSKCKHKKTAIRVIRFDGIG